ncbi:MAG: cell division protein FtsW [Phycisphaerales bacterium]|nr:cell division protein FtsW [Phycisphaerales bacterium]
MTDDLGMIRPGQVIVLCAFALLTMGVVMVQSAGMSVTPLSDGMNPTQSAAVSGVTTSSLLTSRTSVYLLMALGAMIVASFLPVRRLADRLDRVVWFRPGGDLGLLVMGSVCLIAVIVSVYIPGLRREMNGSARWINLHVPGLESIQPSEIAKWALIGVIAWYASRLASYPSNRLHRFWTGLFPAVAAIGVVAFAVVLEDLGTGVLMVAACTIVLLGAGARIRHFAMFIPIGVMGVVAAIMTSPYRVDRITSFINPYKDPAGDGYHMIQSLATVSGGGVFGRGIGHGLQKFGYLPEDTTDFLFAVVCEELGLVGAVIVISLYAAIVWTGTHIIARERNTLLKLITLGIIATFCIQAMINLMVVTGLGPTKGIALPLMSSGGTGWILTAFMLGVVVSIDRTRVFTPEELEAQAFSEGFAERASRDGELVRVVPDRIERFGPMVRRAREESIAPAEMAELIGNPRIVVKPRVRIRPKPMPIDVPDRDDHDEYEQLMLHDE